MGDTAREHGGAARWRRADWIGMSVVTLLGAALRIARLNIPPKLIFDETYYAKDACWYALSSPLRCGTARETSFVHPPLGKWLTAAGIKMFGYDAFGWRIAAAIAGALTVAVLYLLARKILESTAAAVLTSGLLAFDFLHFVQSRVAMLDVFVTFFGLAAVLFVVTDRDEAVARVEDGRRRSRETKALVPARPWRVAAGGALGGAVASKWSGVLFIALCLALALGGEIAARRAEGRVGAAISALRAEGASMFVWLLALPAAIYLATYVGRLEGSLLAAPWTERSWLDSFWDRQIAMARFHLELDATHPYQSPAWSWLLLKRPVAYFFEAANGNYREVLALGNPLVWWSGLLALAATAVSWVRRRRAGGPQGLILAGFGITYLPWLLSGRPAVFTFYVLPAVPFLMLALGYVATKLGESRPGRGLIAAFCVGSLALFVYYYPLLAAVPISQQQWRNRIWIFGEARACAPPERPVPTGPRAPRDAKSATSETKGQSTLPPRGWCWI